jgi:hypothetical protein
MLRKIQDGVDNILVPDTGSGKMPRLMSSMNKSELRGEIGSLYHAIIAALTDWPCRLAEEQPVAPSSNSDDDLIRLLRTIRPDSDPCLLTQYLCPQDSLPFDGRYNDRKIWRFE